MTKAIEINGLTITYNGTLAEKLRILQLLGIPYAPTGEEIAEDQSQEQATQTLKDEYISTINTLQQIESTTNPTNAQVVAAVKFLAKTIRLILKFLARQYT